ncbi:MAG: VOC family protein [Spirochaetia bacterium]|nr:VOC family protein [Spirochaetia bacterium]
MIIIESFQHVNVPAVDIDKSIEFYTMFFDFELTLKEENSAIVSFDNLTLKLQQVEKSEENENKVPLLSFIMDVDDFTEALQDIEENAIPIVAGPSETSKGENIILKDPGGNLLELYYEE